MRDKDFNLLDSLNAGKIPVISDAQLAGAAKVLCGNGFYNICDWHTEQKTSDAAGDRILTKFDADAEKNWDVSQFAAVWSVQFLLIDLFRN